MSAQAPGPSWRVELSRDAAREVREAPPVVRAHLADLLDRLASDGLPPNARSLGDRSYAVRVGNARAVIIAIPLRIPK